MKRIFFIIFALFVLTLAISSCDLGILGSEGVSGGGVNIPVIDNTLDLDQYVPPVSDTEVPDDTEKKDDLYTSKALFLVTEVMGSYSTDRPFSLDPTNENLRIYDDLYLYEGDYFAVYASDLSDIWASLKEPYSYVEEEKAEGYDLQINVKTSGIYKLILDITTMKFEVVYKSPITTPVYEDIPNCQIFTTETEWVDMQRNGDEFCIEGFTVGAGKAVSFFNKIHTSNYKTTIDESCAGKYIYKSFVSNPTTTFFIIGGTYNIYLNAKTYQVRVELVDKETATYSAVVYENNEFKDLTLENSDIPYIYEYTFTTTADYENYRRDDLPSIYSASYQEYSLTPLESEFIGEFDYKGEISYYFKKAGTYRLTINLSDFTISAEKLAK